MTGSAASASVASQEMQQSDKIRILAESTSPSTDVFAWSPTTIFQAIAVFILAGFAEIGGGYMVWAAIRGRSDKNTGITTKEPWWFALVGSLILVAYGFIPCLQPTDSFGRIYAVYGGFFILLSFAFGWVLDGDKPDLGDIIGTVITMVGVCIIMFWPRG